MIRTTDRASEVPDGMLEAIGRGDRNAFRSLFRITSSKLYGIVLRIVRSKEDAEDILQQVYLQVWSNAAGFSPDKGSPLSWMIGIARYRALDHVRSGHVRIERKADTLEAAEQFLVEDRAEKLIAEKLMLDRYLGVLDEETRTMLVLAYCYGYSREELALRFKRPVNTIKTNLRRALLEARKESETKVLP